MFAAISTTILSRRSCALTGSAMTSRSRRNSTRGPPSAPRITSVLRAQASDPHSSLGYSEWPMQAASQSVSKCPVGRRYRPIVSLGPGAGSEPAAVGRDPVVQRVADQAAEDRHIEKWNEPPHPRYAQDHVAIGLESRQGAPVGQNGIQGLEHLIVADDRRGV